VRFYLSRDWVLDAGDIALAESRAVPALAAGDSSSASTTVTIPSGSAPGYYYLLAQADALGAVVESSETNNVGYKFITLQ
jgi:subtilase family serine protease